MPDGNSPRLVWSTCLLPKDFLPENSEGLSLRWDNKWPRRTPPAFAIARLRSAFVSAGRPASWAAAQHGGAMPGPPGFRFPLFLPRPRPLPFPPVLPARRVPGAAPRQGPVRSPRPDPKEANSCGSQECQECSETGNCKSPQPSALPRGFPVTPAPGRAPRS